MKRAPHRSQPESGDLETRFAFRYGNRRFQIQGSSLVVVLTFVSILTLLIVSILGLVSVDTTISSNSLEKTRAENFARYALDEAAEKLSRIPLDKHWAAGPGLLRIWNDSSWDAVNLYSEGTGTDQVDLNAQLPDGSYAIMPPNSDFPTAPEMKVNWRYVLADGRVVDTAPASGAIGRFAYWVDTENSRANINTAGFGMTEFNSALEPWVASLRGNNGGNGEIVSLTTYQQEVWGKNPWATDSVTVQSDGTLSFPALDRSAAQSRTLQNLTGHPSSVDLSFLDGISIQESFNTFRYAGSYFLRVDAKNASLVRDLSGSAPSFHIAQNPDMSVRFFDTPEDWKQIVGDEKFEQNKAYITTRGRSPEINPWGLPKLALSLATEQGNPLNVLTEDFQRNSSFITLNDPPSGSKLSEDSRTSQVPIAMSNNVTATDPGRGIFRDLTTPKVFDNQPMKSSLQRIIAALKRMMETATPEYDPLASKYNAGSPGESEQIAVEMLNFVDQTLNGASPGYPTYVRFWKELSIDPQPDEWVSNYSKSRPYIDTSVIPHVFFNAPGAWRSQNDTRRFYGGCLLPMAGGNSTTRRLGNVGPFLVSEIGAQINTRAYSIPDSPLPPAGSNITTDVPAAILRAAAAPQEAPYCVLSPSKHYSGNLTHPDAPTTAKPVWAFILRKPLTDSAAALTPPLFPSGNATATASRDRWINITFSGENMFPPNWGSKQKLNLGMGTRTYLSDVVLEYRTNDPTYLNGTNEGSLRGYFVSRRDPNTHCSEAFPSSGSFLLRPKLPMPPLANSGISYDTMFQQPDSGVLIGPFRPDSIVSFKVRLRFITSTAVQGNAPGAGSGTLLWHAIPGIFENYETADVAPSMSSNDPSQDEMLEFEITDLKVNSAGYRHVSFEADDPRVARRKSDWQVSTIGSPALENSNFTGSINDQASDLAMPNALLQITRGLLRARAINGAWGDLKGRVERQNASKILGLPGVGHLASIPTGVDAGESWKTMKFHANSDTTPDWLLWNMMFVPFDRSFANNTDGKININATLYPFGIKRTKPLAALLGKRVGNPDAVATNITNRTLGAGASPLVGPPDLYVYNGQVAQIAGVADSGVGEYEKEKVSRGIADIVTTQCSDYRVFIVAQSVRQSPDGKIIPLATQRVEAVLSRVPDEGGRGRGHTYAASGYPFPPTNTLALPANVFERGAYVSDPTGVTPIDLNNTATLNSKGRSFLGADGDPNTSDDWLVPQKIDISTYKTLQ
jgi:hypothetical protein